MKICDLVKHKYYTFFTETLRESENTFSYFQQNKPCFVHLLTSNYLLVLLLSVMLGCEHDDNQLINMGCICLLDFMAEYLSVVPNWRRRQLLILDELIQIFYDKSDLWFTPVYKHAFKEGKSNPPNINELMDEYMLIKEYYGVEMIELHIASLKQRKMEKSQFLRSLSQHAQYVNESKSKLPIYYVIKFLMVSYWYYGDKNF